jgi:hypothetical protein
MNRSRTTTTLSTFLATRMPLAPAGRLFVATAVTAGLWLTSPARADSFFFSTGAFDGRLAALSQPDSTDHLETETADDFVLTETTSIAQATITGLIPSGTPLANIRNVEVEIYHVFDKDSDVSRTSGAPKFSTAQVPTRVNSPSDVEIDEATRDASLGTLAFSPNVLNASFSVDNTVVDGINAMPFNLTQGEGSSSGEVVEITITFTPPIVLPADRYFFRPEVRVAGGDFLFLSAPKPIVAPGTPLTTDLQAWIRSSALQPDWLRIGTDIIGGPIPVRTFNMTMSLTGETVPDAGTPGQANCHGRSVSALAQQFGGLNAAASALGFSTVEALQDGFRVFCEQ